MFNYGNLHYSILSIKCYIKTDGNYQDNPLNLRLNTKQFQENCK